MYGNVLSSPIFAFVLISYCVYIGTVHPKPCFYLCIHPPVPHVSPTPCEIIKPLRVYMYDLPGRFNVGMIDRQRLDDKLATYDNLPLWPSNWGLKQQHSVEYWLMASLLYQGDRDGREAIRVMDPEVADVFFVPFFSSLSFHSHRRFSSIRRLKLIASCK